MLDLMPAPYGRTAANHLLRGPALAQRRHPAPEKESGPLPVAILGAGHGGLALAASLGRAGHRVALWNRSASRIDPVSGLGGVRLTVPGAADVLAPISVATSNIATALAGARVVLVAVPAIGHADIARACAPFLRDGQTVLLLPGRTGGALEFRRVLDEAGCRADVVLGECNTFPVAARCVGPASAVIFAAKDELQVAALPTNRTKELVEACKPILPMVTAARSVLHTGLANVGAILHPVITLLNAERIAHGDSFDFYTDGVTADVAEVLADADAERLRIARAYGLAVSSLPAWIAAAYNHRADTILEAVGGNPAYVGIKAPCSLEHRYLLEDVPTGLVPMLELGTAAGLTLPTLKGLVERARTVLGGERWHRPRTLAALGLAGLGPQGIRAFIAYGKASVLPMTTLVSLPLVKPFHTQLVPQVGAGG